MAAVKLGQDCSICESSLQVPLSAEREGFMRSASEMATTVKDALIHILGNAVAGVPGV
jgi:hypothetical protein